ncbi:uncharacterized protein AB675_127 [Cyphellophora attinorum]|uniref:Uncharacterized protein n=1 Tax=Cyphellophora attinorum TaxID=1664694 RepID=A0A0N1NXP6_9EURO|nr:uncharacterized protein AB675_127 [Phialophora attinorum]KPI37686.1 hypothetical protein AB675_127 [Phialophora attinorum]
MLDGSFMEASSGVVHLHDDPCRGLRLVLNALTTSTPHQYLRGADYRLIQEAYIVTDKYKMASLHRTVTERLLPDIFAFTWELTHHALRLSSNKFKSCHYDFFNEYFSGYPEDLWPLYAKALVHYQRVEPDADLISHLFEDNSKMAHFMIKQLTKEVAVHEDHAKGFKSKLEAEEAKVAALNKKVRDIGDDLNVLAGKLKV